MRTCAGCGTHDTRQSLIRIVAADARLIVDERRALPGRGAWVHPALDCIAQAKRRRALPRILKVQQALCQPDQGFWEDLERVALSEAHRVPERE